MFHLTEPEVVQVIRKNVFAETSSVEGDEVVVISIFGSGPVYPSKSGFKRAFRLALDAFGNVQVFSEQQEPPTDGLDGEGLGEAKGLEELLEKVRLSDGQLGEFYETEERQYRGINGFEDGRVGVVGLEKNQDQRLVYEVPENLQFQRTSEDGDGKQKSADITNACFLDGFFCKKESVVFLHLSGAYDPAELVKSAENICETIKETGFMPVWCTLKSLYCRYLLLLFSLSHVLILSHPSASFDTSYLHLFRVLDAVRVSIKSAISLALDKVGVFPGDWVNHGRICSPRLLFLFDIESEAAALMKTPATFHSGGSNLMRSQLEDEIYHILRKCRIITNISANSLFAIPSEDDYVFLFEKNSENASFVDLPDEDLYLEVINQQCKSFKNNQFSSYRTTSTASSITHAFRSQPTATTYLDMVKHFKRFILLHSRQALKKGFEDDSRRVAEHKHFFIIPTVGLWKIGFNVLYDALLNPVVNVRTVNEGMEQLTKYINVDSEYLYNQCSNVFPKIYAVYQRSLPEFYSEHIHRIRLTNAMNAYLTISRGPGVLPWLNKLAEKCERYWKKGHQQCEVLSLFKNACINQLHQVPFEDTLEIHPVPEMSDTLPLMKHSAGLRLVSYCNCGRKQGHRDAPFTIKEANLSFYERVSKECCESLDRYSFPIFVTTTSAAAFSLEDMLKILQSRSTTCHAVTNEAGINSNPSFHLVEADDLRQDNAIADSQCDDGMDDMCVELEEHDEFDNESYMTEEPIASHTTKVKHSDTEYLPGMIHSKSPPGLLPKFSSWSLVRLGMSSLYNHSSGVSPRSGFLSGTNFMLPWDVLVKAEAGVSKPIPRMIRSRGFNRRSKPVSNEFTVKLFFGLEYECHRGHRFIANDFEKIVNFNVGNSGLREAGTKIAASDMPLYFKCPCKETRAQLMRIHIVTPKAPVHCLLSPRVQPSPSPCPHFFPESAGPITLTPNSYWILRLPYSYVGDDIFIAPIELESSRSTYSRLLKGVMTVQPMTPTETKAWERENL